MNHICDLHTHSVFSDGTLTPSEIAELADAKGLCAVALCDHNTVDGLPCFLNAAKGHNFEPIAGAEFSVDFDGTELHLLALFIAPEHFQKISEMMIDVNIRKEQSNIALCDSLIKAGFKLDYSSMKAKTPNGKINRAHFAAELCRLGCAGSITEAFETLLSPESGHYKEPERITVLDMITFIRSINAVPVLAHPFLELSYDELSAFLPKAKQQGLIGMECEYPRFDDDETQKAHSLAKQFGLLPSGGSDFHGANKPDIELGSGTGSLCVPLSWAEALKASAKA